MGEKVERVNLLYKAFNLHLKKINLYIKLFSIAYISKVILEYLYKYLGLSGVTLNNLHSLSLETLFSVLIFMVLYFFFTVGTILFIVKFLLIFSDSMKQIEKISNEVDTLLKLNK